MWQAFKGEGGGKARSAKHDWRGKDMDHFDSQTFHSFLVFANLITGRDVKNNGVLAGVPAAHICLHF